MTFSMVELVDEDVEFEAELPLVLFPDDPPAPPAPPASEASEEFDDDEDAAPEAECVELQATEEVV